jgi:hypothetical protein
LEQNTLILSKLSKTWFIDIDGTIVEHNGYLNGMDKPLEGAIDFLKSIPEEDFVVFTTARDNKFRTITQDFLRSNDIRYDLILYDLPPGERIVINDKKPSGLLMSHAINLGRNEGFSQVTIKFDGNL